MSDCTTEKFELIDSTEHELNSYPVIVTYMNLFIEPNFDSQSINCIEELQLKAFEAIQKMELDCSNLNVFKITFANSEKSEYLDELGFLCTNDKLIIKLPVINKNQVFKLKIEYNAQPQRGFRFISPNNHYPNKRKQAWTQGQMIESRFWFPTLDEPQIKFPREIAIKVPKEFTSISNGNNYETENGSDFKIYKWKEIHPNPAYLTSIVTGEFFIASEPYEREIELAYYVPDDQKEKVKRTFKDTPKILKFFEKYFDVLYPYKKYSQTTVQDFEYGGMENTTCTTLPDEILLDERAALDDTSTRNVIAHELAHQWFGDLVTCKDWSHIWLNEGFATYCEALYIEEIENDNEFQYYMSLIGDTYFSEVCEDYKRSLVTNRYKYPDELFDAHSYQKGAWILHMLRHIIGEENFKLSLKNYLTKYRDLNVDTDHFRNTLEEISNKNLNGFFQQWVYQDGHPALEFEYNPQENKITIIQTQERPFDFFIDIKIVLKNGDIKVYSLHLSNDKNIFLLSSLENNATSDNIKWISIDPELKILKNIQEYKMPFKFLVNQIKNGKTIVERMQGMLGVSSIQINSSELNELISVLKDRLLNDEFYGVSILAAIMLGSTKTASASDILVNFLETSENIKDTKKKSMIRTYLIISLSKYFSLNDKRDKLELLLKKKDESYNVVSQALIAIGKYKDKRSFDLLCKTLETKDSLADIIPISAIQGLNEFKESKELGEKAMNMIIEKTLEGNSNNIRVAAIDNLKDFLTDASNDNQHKIFQIFLNSLEDKWPDVRKKTLAVLENTFDIDDNIFNQTLINKVLNKIEKISNEDLNYEVRRIAEISLIKIREKHPRQLKEMIVSKIELSNFISKKVKVRTKNVLAPSLQSMIFNTYITRTKY